MIAELWENFPRMLVQNLNGLLDQAEPTPAKAFMLYKTCQREDLWRESFEKFSQHLAAYYARHRRDREKADLDQVFERPINRHIYEEFQLNFRNAHVDSRSVRNLVSWAHNLLRTGSKTESPVISMDVIAQTVDRLIHPAPHEKAENYDLDDFCDAWKKIVFKIYGRRYDAEFLTLLNEIQGLNAQLENQEKAVRKLPFVPTIYLTQTEIDWVVAVQAAAENYERIPVFPLSRGPQKQRLIYLERAGSLYNIVHKTNLPELLLQRENIRLTLLDQCDSLLREKAA